MRIVILCALILTVIGQPPEPAPRPVVRARLSGRMVLITTNVIAVAVGATNILRTNVTIVPLVPGGPISHPQSPPSLPNGLPLTYSTVEKRDAKEIMREFYEARARMENPKFVEPPLPPGGK